MRFLLLMTLSLLIFFSNISFGQNKNKKITVTGIVLDAKQKPVEGAAIFIDKIKTNSVSDQRGYYKVKVSPDSKEILVFTLFNGASVEAINGRTTINFTLTDKSTEPANKDKNDQNETVNVGYGTVQKKNVTTQVGVIDGQDPKFASYQSIYDMIRGRIPGVEVTGKSIKISGSSSLNISTEPLFVVDGVIVNNIDDISPQTVKSIEVLKGPAASVYGTRGANGVILITRLSGKDKK
ncbi:MAG: TonB-dependent receptor plug domain-containing protein [Bacteroidetes bacterium]|nr:TonB-dependent receptor plug domain-containing protein [Bacteroidota bacterium]